MTILRWEEPPTRTPWANAACELQARAGEWGVVAEGLTQGRVESAVKSLRDRGCETRRVKVDGEGWTLYARARVGA